MSKISEIVDVAEKIYSDGSIIVTQNSDVTEKELIKHLNVDKLVTFSLQRQTKSRFNPDATFIRYQQFYKGVKVDGGGYTVKVLKSSDNESAAQLELFSPHIYYNFNLNTHPTIPVESIKTIIGGSIGKPELLISDRYSEEYRLLWKVFYSNGNDEIVWLDAHTGEIVNKVISTYNLTGATPYYGLQTLNDHKQGITTTLATPSDNLRIFQGLVPSPEVDIDEWDNALTPTSTNISDWGTDATPSAMQAFYIANLVIPEFLNMGIDFKNVNIAISGGARAIMGSTTENAYIQIDKFQNQYIASTFDLIAHELGHCYLMQFLNNDDIYKNKALHEGISDIIGTYIESFIQSTDWVIGDDDNDVAIVVNRNLATQVCFTTLQSTDHHEWGRIIGHWFYAISTGIPSADIPSIGLQPAIDIVVEALNSLNNPNAGFPEMRAQTLLAAEMNFGVCSPHYKAVVNAWKKVCVNGLSEQCPCEYDPPTLTTTTVIDGCPIYVDLQPLHNGSIPQDAVLVWSTDGDPWFGHGVSPHISSIVGNTGTYYAYYYNETDDCYSPASIAITVDGANNQDTYITIPTTYDTDMELFGDIYIQDGAVLTITSTLTLDTDVDIFVEKGSKLVLDGGILTACGQRWQGVHVAGELNFAIFSNPAGEVELKSGAILEKAVIGIDATDKFPYAGFSFEYGGGIITLDHSTIRDCDIGIKLAPYGWGYIFGLATTDERSVIQQSNIQDCETGIYSDGNIGLEITGSTFDNYTDYNGLSSSIVAINNTFSSLLLFNADYPLLPGSIFEDNSFGSYIEAQSQSNFTPFRVENNSFLGAGFIALGEVWYEIVGNDFYNSIQGNGTGDTGENIRNIIMDNAFYNNRYANSAYGVNDVEYITNCFEDTDFADIELYHDASIFEVQGAEQLSAGNCFEFSARIKTGTGSQHFTYWTKDGFNFPSSNCKFPGSGNFTRLEADEEATSVNCGRGTEYTGELPPSYQDCECYPGSEGCIEAIEALWEEITELENNTVITLIVKTWLIAKYKKCIDQLMRNFVHDALLREEAEEAIMYLSAQNEFRYKIMAYGIMNQNLDYARSRNYLNTLLTTTTEQQDFVDAQNIYLDYISDIDGFELTAADSSVLDDAGRRLNTLAGYTRSIFYRLTGVRIEIDLHHLDSTITPRSTETESVMTDLMDINDHFFIYPNPVDHDYIEIKIEDFNPDKIYSLLIYDVYGRKSFSSILASGQEAMIMDDSPGIYMATFLVDGQVVSTQKILKF